MSKKKYSKEFRLKVLMEHKEEASFYSLEKKYDIVLGTVKRWNAAFKAPGETALLSGKLNDALSGRLFCADFRTLQMCQSL